MKHLKTYKIFESVDNFLLDCQDILLELKDNGFDVQFRTVFVDSYINHDGPVAGCIVDQALDTVPLVTITR